MSKLNSPESLTAFFVDQVNCNEIYHKHLSCLDDYHNKIFSFRSKKKQYQACMAHLDKYKSCMVGNNQERMLYKFQQSDINELDILKMRQKREMQQQQHRQKNAEQRAKRQEEEGKGGEKEEEIRL